MNIEEIRAFEADLAADTSLTHIDKTTLKDKFFQQKIMTSPEWVEAPPDIRFKFAKQFGVSPGIAQAFPGEIYVAGGKPVTGEFGEGPFETGFLSMPKGELGEVREPSPWQGDIMGTLMDPTNALTGGVAGAVAKIPGLGAMLAARNPLLRDAARRGISGSALDWQLMGLHRLPGFIGRQAGNIMQRLRAGAPQATPPQGAAPQMGRPSPGSGAPQDMRPGATPQPEISGGSLPQAPPPGRPRFRYGPTGIEDISQ